MIRRIIAFSPEVLRTLAANPEGRKTLEMGLREYLFRRDDASEQQRARLDPLYAKVQAALEAVPPPTYAEVKA